MKLVAGFLIGCIIGSLIGVGVVALMHFVETF